MDWIAFAYSLPSKEGSGPRVAMWRRLRRLGTLPVAGGIQILPDREECMEALQWLAQEIRTANGEASVMRVSRLEGFTDQQLAALFSAARTEDYRHIEESAAELKQAITVRKATDISETRDNVAKLRRHYTDIARIDYFNSQEGRQVASLLEDIEQALSPETPVIISVPKAQIDEYHNKCWVTRPHPYVDRLACSWLIRHFINSQAVILYSNNEAPGAVVFDMDRGEFGHRGNLCTFEVMRLAFGLDDAALRPIAEIVHEIDLHDARYAWPETAGIETLLNGWSQAGLSDEELELKGFSIFEGLYVAFSSSLVPSNSHKKAT